MELKKIEYFLRIVEEGGLSKAAQSLYLTQPTLSRFLAKLEEEAGIPLFHRRRDSSLELTEAGKVYLHSARRIYELWRRMESELDALRQTQNGIIRLGFDNDAMYPKLRECEEAVTAAFPNVTLQTDCLYSQQIQEGVMEGRLDMGLTSYYQYSDRLSYTYIEENEIDLVVGMNHPLAGKDRLEITELPPDTPFALMRQGHVLRQCVDDYMQTMGITPCVPNTYIRQDLLGKIMEGNDKMVGFCPRNQHVPGFSYIRLDPPFYHKRGICYAKGRKLSPPEKLLARLLCGNE